MLEKRKLQFESKNAYIVIENLNGHRFDYHHAGAFGTATQE